MVERIVRRVLPERLVDRIRENRAATIRKGVGSGLKIDTRRASGDYHSGLNELPVQQSLAQYLKAGDVFYDIGANTGFLTLIGALLVGESGVVYAFEPVPQNADVIRHNLQLNEFHHVRVIQKAVASTPGQGDLLLTRHPGGATLVTNQPPPDATSTTSVGLVSIDDLVFQQKFEPPTLVKIDVEGAEMDVLQGMEQVLRVVRPIVLYEIDDEFEEGFTRKTAECETYLRARNYNVTRLTDSYPTMSWRVGHFLAIPG